MVCSIKNKLGLALKIIGQNKNNIYIPSLKENKLPEPYKGKGILNENEKTKIYTEKKYIYIKNKIITAI